MASALLRGFDLEELATPTMAGWVAQYGEPSDEVRALINIALLLMNTPDPE